MFCSVQIVYTSFLRAMAINTNLWPIMRINYQLEGLRYVNYVLAVEAEH